MLFRSWRNMWKREIRVKWNIRNVCVLSIDKRFRENRLKQQEEYAVIGVGTITDFDEISDETHRGYRKVKPLILMCFSPSTYNLISEGNVYSFSGKVGFGYGNTYFTIEKALLPGGFPLEEKEREEEEEGESPPLVEGQAPVSVDKEGGS